MISIPEMGRCLLRHFKLRRLLTPQAFVRKAAIMAEWYDKEAGGGVQFYVPNLKDLVRPR